MFFKIGSVGGWAKRLWKSCSKTKYIGLNARRPVFRFYDLMRLKPACSATETG